MFLLLALELFQTLTFPFSFVIPETFHCFQQAFLQLFSAINPALLLSSKIPLTPFLFYFFHKLYFSDGFPFHDFAPNTGFAVTFLRILYPVEKLFDGEFSEFDGFYVY